MSDEDLAGNEFVPSHTTGVDHEKVITASERIGSAAYSMSMLCKQDKEQLDRIEDKLDKLLAIVNKT